MAILLIILGTINSNQNYLASDNKATMKSISIKLIATSLIINMLVSGCKSAKELRIEKLKDKLEQIDIEISTPEELKPYYELKKIAYSNSYVNTYGSDTIHAKCIAHISRSAGIYTPEKEPYGLTWSMLNCPDLFIFQSWKSAKEFYLMQVKAQYANKLCGEAPIYKQSEEYQVFKECYRMIVDRFNQIDVDTLDVAQPKRKS